MIYWKNVNFRPREFVTYIVVVSYDQPNTFAEVTCKQNLWKHPVFKNAPFSAIFIEIILNFQKCENASFWGMIRLNNIRKQV